MFAAQPESATIEVEKEKPPDSTNSVKRAHRKRLKKGSSAKQSYETQTIREDKNRQRMEHSRSLDSAGIDKHVKSSAIVTKNNRLNLKKAHGSRFAILNDSTDVEEAEEELQG
ncbi:hypothetical protein Q3G72_009587 [Acer saccharum]|nr:hypothetical protein Q3G72_009587 [Acer saccharum]